MRPPVSPLRSPSLLLSTWLALLALPGGVRSAVVPYTLASLVERSKWIVVAEVVELRAHRASFQGLGELILTDVVLRVEETIQGDPATHQLTARVLGGEIGEEFQRCPESPSFEKGARVLVFLREHQGALWTTGWRQGEYAIGADGVTVQGAPELPISQPRPLAEVKGEVTRLAAASRVTPRSLEGPVPVDAGGRR